MTSTHVVGRSCLQTRTLYGCALKRQTPTAAYMTSSPPLPPCALDLYGEQVFLKPATQYCFAELVEPYQEATPSVGTPRGFRLGPPVPVRSVRLRRSEAT